MILRALQRKDVAKIVEAEKRCFSDPWDERAFFAELDNPFCQGSLAEEGGQVCGYCCLFVLFEDAEVHNIAVDIPFRGRGVAKELMDAMHEKAKSLGAERSILEVRVSNTPAIGLYTKYGYERYGVRTGYYPDGEDALVMWKKL